MIYKSVGPKVVLVFSVVLAILFGCNKAENSTVYVKTKLAPVTNVRAYSASGAAVVLQWDPSADQSRSQYSFLRLVVRDENGNVIYPGISVPKERTDTTIVGLNEGNIHTFEFTSIASSDQLFDNSDPVHIQWASATRFPVNPDSSIRIYEYQQTGAAPCGLQFLNTDTPPYLPGVFRIDTAGRKQDKIDVFLREVPNSGGLIVIESAHQNPLLAPGVTARRTRFSNLELLAPSLNVARQAPPILSTYTLDRLVMAPTVVQSGKLFYALANDSNFVRIYVKRNDATQSLVGLAPGGVRFVDIQISYQAIRKVIYAKLNAEVRTADRGVQ